MQMYISKQSNFALFMIYSTANLSEMFLRRDLKETSEWSSWNIRLKLWLHFFLGVAAAAAEKCTPSVSSCLACLLPCYLNISYSISAPPLYLQVHLSCPRFSFLIPLSLKFQIESIFSLKLANMTLSVLKSSTLTIAEQSKGQSFSDSCKFVFLILLRACHKFQRPNPFVSRVFENIFQVFSRF